MNLDFSAFHFLRPLWLLLIVPGLLFPLLWLRRHDLARQLDGIIAPHLLGLLVIAPRDERRLRPVHLLGEGIPFHRASLDASDHQTAVTDASAWVARASAVARLGAAMGQRGQFADPLRLAPLYIRLPEAEEKRLAESKNT